MTTMKTQTKVFAVSLQSTEKYDYRATSMNVFIRGYLPKSGGIEAQSMLGGNSKPHRNRRGRSVTSLFPEHQNAENRTTHNYALRTPYARLITLPHPFHPFHPSHPFHLNPINYLIAVDSVEELPCGLRAQVDFWLTPSSSMDLYSSSN